MTPNYTPNTLRCVLLFLLFLIMTTNIQGQNLPKAWRFSPDGHRMIIGNKVATNGLYDSTKIRNYYLTFAQPNYWALLTSGYTAHTDVLANLMVDSVAYDSVGVRFKGMTSYSQVPGQKKSFNISMNTYRPTQDLKGYNTTNLNNSFGDRSCLREVFYLHQIQKHVPASKANFVHLYINNQDWGLYPNIQQLNKDFYKEWFLSNDGVNFRADKPPGTPGGGGGGNWGDGTAALNYFADTAAYTTKYTLKSNDGVSNPWATLQTVCDKLNNTPTAQLPLILPDYIDIDRSLWFLASEVAFSDDDSYIYKGKMDYYCYYEPETGRLTPQEYDGNSVMSTQAATWSAFYNATNANYPLFNKLMAVPQWRQRYLAHLRTIITDELNVASANQMLDNYKIQIDALIQADPKKLMTHAQFTSEIPVLKNFVNSRRNSLLANAEVAQVAPVITNAKYTNINNADWGAVRPAEVAHVQAQMTHTTGIFAAKLYYATGLVGNFAPATMYDDGAHNDAAANDGIFGADLPAQLAGTRVRFYVESAANNTAKSLSYMPVGAEHDVYTYWVTPTMMTNAPVIINEIMANNTINTDNAGEYEDYIELYNKANQPIDLSGWYITDNPQNDLKKWQIPTNTTIAANGYAIIWADEDGTQGANHANFKLSSTDGETLWLMNPNGEIADSLSFGAQATDVSWARVPNGTGNFMNNPNTFNADNTLVNTNEIAQNNVQIYPNPAQNQINIITTNTNHNLLITNALGKNMYQTKTTQNHMTIDTQAWAAGVYTLQMGNSKQKFVLIK